MSDLAPDILKQMARVAAIENLRMQTAYSAGDEDCEPVTPRSGASRQREDLLAILPKIPKRPFGVLALALRLGIPRSAAYRVKVLLETSGALEPTRRVPGGWSPSVRTPDFDNVYKGIMSSLGELPR